MTERIDCVVIGAGVVGLAIARAMAARGLETVVLEANTLIGSETSSRNSEVIHAGIYYPKGSLKASLCVRGKQMLYHYCAERSIGHRRCGKYIVATTPEQLPMLPGFIAQAAANGVDDLRQIEAAEAREHEPDLNCVGAVHSPSTGIIDSHGFMLALQGDLERDGGMVAFASPVLGGAVIDNGIRLQVGGDDASELDASLVVNCAGLGASRVAAAIQGFDASHVAPTYLAKGNYYSLTGRAPFSRLIYPVPEPGGLGVHLTIDLAGQARFGPDVEWIDHIDYTVDPRRADAFYAQIRKYWPALPDGALQPAYAGIRPKPHPRGEPAADFVIEGPDQHGVRGLVNLFGIESPGLTSSLAIAAHVDALLHGTAGAP